MLLSMEPVNGPLELHLVGGYDDSDEADDEDLTGGPFDLADTPGEENWSDRGSAHGETSRRQGLGKTRSWGGGGLEGAGRLQKPPPGVQNMGLLEALGKEEVSPGLQGVLQESGSPEKGAARQGGSPMRGQKEVSPEQNRAERVGHLDEEGRSHSLGKRSREEEGAGGANDESESPAKAQRDSDGKGKRLVQDPDARAGSVAELETRGLEEEYEDAAGPIIGGQSWPLAAALVGILHRSNVCLELKTACILGHNTKRDRDLGSLSMPVVRGLGIEPKSGRAFPVTFSAKARGPDGVVR
jgi:hypothetical protein